MNFNIRHVFNKKHIAADELSRKSRKFSDEIDEVHEKNINDFIDDQFNYMRVCSMRIREKDD